MKMGSRRFAPNEFLRHRIHCRRISLHKYRLLSFGTFLRHSLALPCRYWIRSIPDNDGAYMPFGACYSTILYGWNFWLQLFRTDISTFIGKRFFYLLYYSIQKFLIIRKSSCSYNGIDPISRLLIGPPLCISTFGKTFYCQQNLSKGYPISCKCPTIPSA